MLNEDQPTRLTSTNQSSPDISIATSSLACNCTWSVEKTLGSDHLPITISLAGNQEKVPSPPGTFINFKKANWTRFKEITEASFAREDPPTCPLNGEKKFREILHHASKIAVPTGRRKEIYPGLPTEAVTLMEKRDELRQNNGTDEEIVELSHKISKVITEHQRNKWREHVENDRTSHWQLIKTLSKPKVTTENIILTFGDKTVHNNRSCANLLCKQYCPPGKPDPKESRTLKRKLKSFTKWQPNLNGEDVANAIKLIKNSKALGPDDIASIHLKHLGSRAHTYMAQLFNLIVESCKIPEIWKTGRVIPLPKPGKPANISTSYRPISLLSPAAKLLEKLLLPTICRGFTPAPHQHGFLKGRSTVSALLEIHGHISDRLNKRKLSR